MGEMHDDEPWEPLIEVATWCPPMAKTSTEEVVFGALDGPKNVTITGAEYKGIPVRKLVNYRRPNQPGGWEPAYQEYMINESKRRETNMEGLTLVTQREMLQSQIDRVSKRLAELDKFGDDKYDTETMIQFDRRFEPNGKIYNYAGIKIANGKWSITGSQNLYPMTWDELITMFTNKGEVTYFAVIDDRASGPVLVDTGDRADEKS